MWRATTMALGLCMVFLGGEAMIVDHVVLANRDSDHQSNDPYGYAIPTSSYGPLSTEQFASYGATLPSSPRRIFVPPDWAPWGLLSAGVLTFLYATAMPGGGGED